jgi:hypothetical protein
MGNAGEGMGERAGEAAGRWRNFRGSEPRYGLDRKEKGYAYLFIKMNKYSISGTA